MVIENMINVKMMTMKIRTHEILLNNVKMMTMKIRTHEILLKKSSY